MNTPFLGRHQIYIIVQKHAYKQNTHVHTHTHLNVSWMQLSQEQHTHNVHMRSFNAQNSNQSMGFLSFTEAPAVYYSFFSLLIC